MELPRVFKPGDSYCVNSYHVKQAYHIMGRNYWTKESANKQNMCPISTASFLDQDRLLDGHMDRWIDGYMGRWVDG